MIFSVLSFTLLKQIYIRLAANRTYCQSKIERGLVFQLRVKDAKRYTNQSNDNQEEHNEVW